ncbi:response regulator [Enemella sp. A6]|uniref:response regulator n=1 Tax=Enemella sp. A6 TaxID=3440152 RepID=UPI003EBF1102
MSQVRVGIVDDQSLLVSAFAALVNNQPDLTVVGTGSDGLEAIDLCDRHEVDVLLMDIRMPRLDGVAATRRIVADRDRPRVLILTTFNVDELVLSAIGAGARGFLLKDADPDQVLDAIRAVHRGEAVIASQAAPALLDALRTGRELPSDEARPDEAGPDDGRPTEAASEPGPELPAELTARELEVLTLIGRGRSNTEIAEDLFIAETTVKTHVGNLLMKLQARDRVALVVLAHSVGLVGGPAQRSVPLG